jgi:hypothetical protein
MRVLLLVVLCLVSVPAKAMTTIDLFTSPQIDGPYIFAGPCYCGNAYATGFFAVTPGDVVDFGVMTISSMWLQSPDSWPDPAVPVNFPLVINTNITHPITGAGIGPFRDISITY